MRNGLGEKKGRVRVVNRFISKKRSEGKQRATLEESATYMGQSRLRMQ